MERLGGVILATILAAACGALPSVGDQTGLACQHPPQQVAGADGRDPFGPGEAFAGRDLSTMTAAEIATIATDAGLHLTWRFYYRIGQPGTETQTGYAECWCVPPPAGRVTSLSFDTGGRLIIYVDSGQTVAQARPQPHMGWGCDAAIADPGGHSSSITWVASKFLSTSSVSGRRLIP